MMDTSEQYIKMCEKAYPILGVTDGVKHLITKDRDKYPDGCFLLSSRIDDNVIGQVYQQDDLQGMVKQYWWAEDQPINGNVVLLDSFQDWVLNHCGGLEWAHLKDPSREQLELCFVMHEIHKLRWDSQQERWVDVMERTIKGKLGMVYGNGNMDIFIGDELMDDIMKSILETISHIPLGREVEITIRTVENEDNS